MTTGECPRVAGGRGRFGWTCRPNGTFNGIGARSGYRAPHMGVAMDEALRDYIDQAGRSRPDARH